MGRLRVKGAIENTRLLSIDQASQYVGLGQTTFKRWAAQIGATRNFGRRVMFDKVVIDKALDAMTVDTVQEI